MALTKEQVKAAVRQGKGKVDYVPADELEDGAELAVRPLTQGEVDDVGAIQMRGQKMSSSVSPDRIVRRRRGEGGDNGRPDQVLDGGVAHQLDLSKSAKAQAEADRLTVAYALSVTEKWSERDARDLPPPVFRRVLTKAKELTGDDTLTQDVAATFRSDAGGAGDRSAPSDGDAAGGDAG